MNHHVLRATATSLSEMGVNYLPLSAFRGCSTHPLVRSLLRMNITLGQFAKTDQERLSLVSAIFGRPVDSTYDLTVAEVRAFLQLAYPEHPLELSPAFALYLEETLHEIPGP